MARIVREYGMGYFDVLALPLVTFWSFNRQIDRLRAEQEQRQLRLLIAGSSESPEVAKKLSDTLANEIGKPTIVEKPFDDEKFKELARKFSPKRMASETHTE